MNKKQLIGIIRKVVKEEVKKELNEIFTKEETSSQLQDIVPEVSVSKKSTKKEQKVYTDNPVLNKVLNETVGGIMEGASNVQPGQEDWPSMDNKVFTQDDTANVVSLNKPVVNRRDMVAADSIAKSGVKLDDVPEATINALTRDYSGLMKAINKKNTNGIQ
jgi:hypothetical protein